MKIILVLLLSLIACNRQTPTDNQEKDKPKIPEDVLLNTNQMNLEEVLKYCNVEIDSFENDTTYSFFNVFSVGKENAKSAADISIITFRVYFYVPASALGLSYTIYPDNYEDFEIVKFKIDENKPEFITANDFKGNIQHTLNARIKFKDEFALIKKIATNSNVLVRIDTSEEYDHLMSIQQKNSILLMLRLIELKNYRVDLY